VSLAGRRAGRWPGTSAAPHERVHGRSAAVPGGCRREPAGREHNVVLHGVRRMYGSPAKMVHKARECRSGQISVVFLSGQLHLWPVDSAGGDNGTLLRSHVARRGASVTATLSPMLELRSDRSSGGASLPELGWRKSGTCSTGRQNRYATGVDRCCARLLAGFAAAFVGGLTSLGANIAYIFHGSAWRSITDWSHSIDEVLNLGF
jgi:hypothetical protein